MDTPILADIRAACNLEEDDAGFDRQLIPLINSQLMVAHQFGVGINGFTVKGMNEKWSDVLGNNANMLAAFKTWLGYSVLLMFDPPDNGTVLKSYQDQIDKMEWMLCSKSRLEGYTKQYAPEHADFYDEDINN